MMAGSLAQIHLHSPTPPPLLPRPRCPPDPHPPTGSPNLCSTSHQAACHARVRQPPQIPSGLALLPLSAKGWQGAAPCI